MLPSWYSIRARQLPTLKISDITTADVARNIFPARVRTYRMTRISNAFCTVRVTRLAYFKIVVCFSSEKWSEMN